MKRIKEIFIIGTCLLIWAVLLGGWTYTLNISTPDGATDDPREADDRMREIKGAFVERLDIDHYFAASATSTYDAPDTGKHRYVTFREPNDLTTMPADESAVFSKDANSLTELHWIDESDNVVQLTSGGYIYGNNLKADSVLTAAIADANITAAKMADDSIDSNSYVDGSIDTAHIADSNVTSTKIADATILPADVNSIFGSWTNLDSGSNALVKDGVYKAGSDGFITVRTSSGLNSIKIYTDGSNPPATLRIYQDATGTGKESCMCPIKKNDYFEVNGTYVTPIYWLPIGSGTCVKQ